MADPTRKDDVDDYSGTDPGRSRGVDDERAPGDDVRGIAPEEDDEFEDVEEEEEEDY